MDSIQKNHADSPDLKLLRIMCLVGIFIAPAFGIVIKIFTPQYVDVISVRALLTVSYVILLILTFTSTIVKKYTKYVINIYAYTLAAYLLLLTYINNFSPDYTMILLVIIFICNSFFNKYSQYVTFNIIVGTVCVVVSFLHPHPQVSPPFFSATVVSMIVSLWYILRPRVVLQEELKQREEVLNTIFNGVTDALFVVDPTSKKIIDCNESSLHMFETEKKEELIGRDLSSFFKAPLAINEKELLFNELHEQKSWEEQTSCLTNTGREFIGNVGLRKIFINNEGTILARIADITKIAEAEDALRKEKEIVEQKVVERTKEMQIEHAKLESSINSLNIGYIMIDASEKIVTMNKASKTMLEKGLKQYNQQAEPIFDIESITLDQLNDVLGTDFHLSAEVKKCIHESKPLDTPSVQVGAMYFHINLSPILETPHDVVPLGCVVILEDITEAKMLDKSKNDFFAIASHELRTPLTAIRWNTALFKQNYRDLLRDKKINQVITDVHDASVRLINMVNDFLNVSRLEQKRMMYNKESFSIEKTIEESVREIAATNEKNIPLHIIPPSQPLPLVFADKSRVKEVLLNLLGNALKFTDKGFVQVETYVERKFIRVEIADTGRGIPLENQHLLFRKFQLASENVLSRDTQRSTGLGLYISRLMMEEMGGTVFLKRSETGVGSVFVFTIPLANADPLSSEINTLQHLLAT